jgi:hypothetical protein
MRQILTATIMYANENKGYLPYTGWGAGWNWGAGVPANKINSWA